MRPLKKYTDEELRAELDKRKQAAYVASLPTPIDNPDWTDVIEFAKEMVTIRANPELYDDDDNIHYLWEGVMVSLYGKDIWKWWNSIEKDYE